MAVRYSSISKWLIACGIAFLLFAQSTTFVLAQQPAAPPPEKLSELIKLMDDPALRAWIEAEKKNAPAKTEDEEPSTAEIWESRARANYHAAFDGMPKIGTEIAAAISRVRSQSGQSGFAPPVVFLAIALAFALAGEWVFRRIMRRYRQSDTQSAKAGLELSALGVFTMIAVLFFLSLEWPSLMRPVLLFYLLAAICFRLVHAFASIMRDMGTLSTYLYRRVLLVSGVLFFTMASTAIAKSLAVSTEARIAAVFLASIVLAVLVIEAIWRQPEQPLRTRLLRVLYVVGLWLFLSFGFRLIFWIGVLFAVLPIVLSSMDRLARAFAREHWQDDKADGIRTVLVVYGVRTVILSAAVLWLVTIWKFNPQIFGQDNFIVTSIVPGLFKAAVILLIADFGWRVVKALIDRKLDSVSGVTSLPPAEEARRARLRTLLPIFRNGLAALLLIITGLTVLSQMGVQIGPLIAGAGIFGVAIGFGSQTLVKDVISGVFYLMDDAFRVGEYIQSGSYKGTVESFSLRSVRLRHHRGPVFTVPFGELGAVQNMSRDWVIEKFLLRVTFNSDIAKAKKLVKEIGAQLLEDPELGPLIIETVKMKGVEQINELGVELAFAFTSVPGSQSMIRRRAYVLIRQTFQENGIEFAQPTVQIGGEDKNDAAAAALLMAKKQAEAAAGGQAAE